MSKLHFLKIPFGFDFKFNYSDKYECNGGQNYENLIWELFSLLDTVLDSRVNRSGASSDSDWHKRRIEASDWLRKIWESWHPWRVTTTPCHEKVSITRPAFPRWEETCWVFLPNERRLLEKSSRGLQTSNIHPQFVTFRLNQSTEHILFW